VNTFAEGIATRATYDLTFPALLDGLAGFVTATDDELRAGMRELWAHTHNLAEGAGAAGLAGLLRLGDELAGLTVGIVISGGNCDAKTAARALGA
jgi:threonine dehydratase